MQHLHQINANFQAEPAGVRRDVFEGREHIVVPVVMICDGVLNGALVTQEEYGRHVESWNGRPVPVLHPERNGIPVSANQPDIIERNTIGLLFNARTDNGKLKADAWLDTQKAARLGYGDLVRQIEAGEVVEVSTGYFADDEARIGTFNGKEYRVIHRNIRPDHLALLPGEIGACSVADGCGTRVNSQEKQKGSFAMKVNEAMVTLARALGLKSNCECEGDSMDVLKQAEGLVKANALSAKQLEALQGMEKGDLDLMAAFISALGQTQTAEAMPEEEPEAAEYDEDKNMTANKDAAKAEMPDIDALVANKVAEHLRRHDVVSKLVANDKNPFDEDDMKAMSVDQLVKLEKSIRPADYSGQGGFAANSDAVDTNVTPMPLRGVIKRKEAKA
jgi:hypothetical protein